MAGTTTTDERKLRPSDLERLTGCTFRQLDHWCRAHPIHQGRRSVNANATRLLFTKPEALMVLALATMGRHGVMASQYADVTIAAIRACPDAGWLLVAGPTVEAFIYPDEAMDAIDFGTFTMLVPLTFLETK